MLSALLLLATQSHVARGQDAQEQAGDSARIQFSQMLNAIAPYNPRSNVDGKATLTGSTTMQQLGLQWSTRFKQFHPSVEFVRGSDGSAAALQSLHDDPTAIAGVSRMITADEVAYLRSGKCSDPAVVIVGLEPMALLVNSSNPIQSITPDQLRLLSADRGSPVTWGEVGVSGPLAKSPIQVFGRGASSGVQGFTEATILGGQGKAALAKSFTSNAEMLDAVAKTPGGMAICGPHQANGTKVIGLNINGQTIMPNEANFLAGQYPLIRPLTLVFDRALVDKDGGLRREILSYVLSRDGQAEVLRSGFFPVNPNFIAQQMASFTGPQLR